MPSVQFNGGRTSARINYTVEADIAGNYSTVRVTSVEVRSEWGEGGSCWLTGNIRVNGTVAATLTLNNVAGCGVILSGSWSGGGSGWSGWEAAPVRVDHSPDGTCTHIPMAVWLSVDTTSGGDRGGVFTTQYFDLPAIPKVSSVSISSAALGQPIQIRITPVTSGVTDTLTWTCGTESGTIGQDLSGTAEWTPPLILAAQAPDADSVEILLTVTSFLAGARLGSAETALRCPIPDYVVPTLAVTVTEQVGHREKYGGFVRGKTPIRVLTEAEGAYGSGIVQTDVRLGSLTAKGQEAAFLSPESGEVALNVTVTDSRGRRASVSRTVQVLAYEEPAAAVENLGRCAGDGSELPDGGFGAVTFSGRAEPLGGNSVRWYLEYRLRGAESWSRLEMREHRGNFSPEAAVFVFPAGVDRTFEVRVAGEDDFVCRTSGAVLLPVAYAMLDLCREPLAVGIGQRANTPGMLSVGMDMKLFGHRITDLGDPVEDADAATKRYAEGLAAAAQQYAETLAGNAYPVGAVYVSADALSPAARFGGTWERIGRYVSTVSKQTIKNINASYYGSADVNSPPYTGQWWTINRNVLTVNFGYVRSNASAQMTDEASIGSIPVALGEHFRGWIGGASTGGNAAGGILLKSDGAGNDLICKNKTVYQTTGWAYAWTAGTMTIDLSQFDWKITDGNVKTVCEYVWRRTNWEETE